MPKTKMLPILLAPLLLAACGPGPLAEAGAHRLSVDDAAGLIAEHSSVLADTQVVRVLAELWVDYTLLASRLDADTTLASLNVDPVTEPPRLEMTLALLRDEVLQVDTAVSDEELTERFAAELPGARATASQILLAFPPGATTRQRDSVLTFARSVREQLGGGDFAGMAQRFSADPGSGSRGGSLGTFERGQMLAPIDQAVFSLRPGELSDPVETGLGYHILRLDSLAVPELSEVAGEFRRRIQLERLGDAEAAYIMQLDSLAGLALAEDALQITRGLLTASPARLPGRAAQRPLLVWANGSYTSGEFLELFQNSPEGFAESVATAGDDELEAALLRLGREQLLLQEARARGLEPDEAAIDSLAAEARSAIRERAAAIGLTPRRAMAPDSTGAAVGDSVQVGFEELVEAALARVVSGEQEIIPLGPITLLLRDQSDWRINANRIGAAVARSQVERSP